jgi:hypothetical protein
MGVTVLIYIDIRELLSNSVGIVVEMKSATSVKLINDKVRTLTKR